MLKIKTVQLIRKDRPDARTRISFFHEGENIVENIQNRFRRPYDAYRELIPDVLTLAQRIGIDEKTGAQRGSSEDLPHPDSFHFPFAGIPAIQTARAKWSQRCGCSCGCSPGFKLPYWVFGRYDIYVDIELIPE